MKTKKLNMKELVELTFFRQIDKDTLEIFGNIDELNCIDFLDIKFCLKNFKLEYTFESDDIKIIEKSINVIQQIFNNQKLNIDLNYEIEKDYDFNIEPNEKKFNKKNQISFDDIRYIDKINYTNDELTLSKQITNKIKTKNNSKFNENYGVSLN